MAVHWNVSVYFIEAPLDEYWLFYKKVKLTLEQAIKARGGELEV